MTASYSKTAKMDSAMQAALLASALPVGVGAVASGVQGLARWGMEQRAKATAYKEMMQLHPQLREADQSKVKRYYGTLSRFNPTMAKDPTVSGAWIRNIIDNESMIDDMQGGVTLLNAVKDLAQIRNHVSGAVSREKPGPGMAGKLETIVGRAMNDEFQQELHHQRNLNKAFTDEVKSWDNPDQRQTFIDNVHEHLRRQRQREYGAQAGF